MAITQARTMTYNGTEFYARTHKNVVDGLKNASTTEAGLMSPADKTKLDGLQNVNPQTNAVTYHNATTSSDGLMSAADKTKLDGLHNTTAPTYANATTTTAGLMSPEDKRKLDELDTNSNAYDFMSGGSSDDSDPIAATPLNSNINYWPSISQVTTLGKHVSDCRTGIVLVWRLDNEDDLYHYQHIPKYHVVGHAAKKVMEVIPISATESIIKTVIVNNTTLKGTNDNYNAQSKANKVRLHEILEY